MIPAICAAGLDFRFDNVGDYSPLFTEVGLPRAFLLGGKPYRRK